MVDYNAYKAHLTEIYQAEIDMLAKRFGPTAQVVDTGGGCMAIEAVIGDAPGSGHPLLLLITTIDNGLAEGREDILHWYACVYDTVDTSDAIADGHDLQSFEMAYEVALAHMRDGVPASDELCSCFLVGESER
ncbi:hypothetical protein ACFYTS_36385 [Nocardia sp. NPDC004151]|uniref:hypothetical protein n=1 Tax=Nocardia sp. NPDC004151 TaxID=3364304 RepID=UPI003676769D